MPLLRSLVIQTVVRMAYIFSVKIKAGKAERLLTTVLMFTAVKAKPHLYFEQLIGITPDP